MQPWYPYLFHQLSKNHKSGRSHHIGSDPRQWPEQWRTSYYKVYERLPKIELVKGECSAELRHTLDRRASARDFGLYTLTEKELGTLLYTALGLNEHNQVNRRYPSGGALYPVETYLFLWKAVGKIESGIYHYCAPQHVLTQLSDQVFTPSEIDDVTFYPWLRNSHALVIFTGLFQRATDKYGYRGYRNTLIEAGHMGQNVSLVATALDIKHCSITGTHDEKIETLLDIDGSTESVVYGIALGR